MPAFAFPVSILVFVFAFLSIVSILLGHTRIAIAAAHCAYEFVAKASLVSCTCCTPEFERRIGGLLLGACDVSRLQIKQGVTSTPSQLLSNAQKVPDGDRQAQISSMTLLRPSTSSIRSGIYSTAGQGRILNSLPATAQICNLLSYSFQSLSHCLCGDDETPKYN